MLIRCQHCQTPFTLTHENILTALDQLEDNGWKHYNAYCPRCGRANVVGREQLMTAAPEWSPTGIVSPRPEPVTTPLEPVALPRPVQTAPKPAAKAAKPTKKAASKKAAAKVKKPAAKKAKVKTTAAKKKPAAKPKSKSKPAKKKSKKK